MPLLALTRAGVAAAVKNNAPTDPIWMGSDVLSEAEVQQLRAAGREVSVFIHAVRTRDEIEDAIPTVREHHPNSTVWIEATPENYNPRSSDISQAFLWQEYIVGVHFKHNEPVAVVSGPHAGEQGSLVSLIALEPEPEFTLEAESGQDIQVRQSNLVRADA
jgi:hypothetical protein